MQNTETGYASSVNVTQSRTRRKVTGEPRTLKGVRVVRRGGARKRVSRLRETPRRAPYPVFGSRNRTECGWRTQNGDLGPPSARSCLPRSSFRAKRPSRLAHSVVQQGWINLVSPSWPIRLRHVVKVFRIATGMSKNLEL